MQLTKKQLEFWTVILLLCIGTAVMVLILDFGIKAAILEESTRMRLKIEEWEKLNGRVPAEANASRNANDASDDPALPGDVLVVNPSRMEAGGHPNGSTAAARKTRQRRSEPHGEATDNPVQS